MSAIVTTGGNGSGLIPQNLADAMRLAEMMAKGKMVPEHLRNPSDMLMVIEQACRWGMSPFAVAQCTSVIQGRLMFEGKLVAAAVQASGILLTRFKYDYEGTGDDRAVVVSAQISGEPAPRTIKIILKDVRTKNREGQINKQWTGGQVDQQLSYAGVRAWARRHTPEVMLGVYSPEEFDAAPARDTFSGTTIDAAPAATAAPSPDAPKVRTRVDYLNELAADLVACKTGEELDAILARDEVQKAQDTFRNGHKERLDAMLHAAIAKFAAAESSAPADAEPDDAPPAPADTTTDALHARTLDLVRDIGARDKATLPALTASGKYTRFVDDLEKSGRLDLMARVRDANAAALLREPADAQ